MDYVTYLTIFDRFFDIPKEKKNGEYRTYLQYLVDYLVDYLTRVKPIMDIDALFVQIENDFNPQYDSNTFPGWPVSSIYKWDCTIV